jgi:hypothetical protein
METRNLRPWDIQEAGTGGKVPGGHHESTDYISSVPPKIGQVPSLATNIAELMAEWGCGSGLLPSKRLIN